MSKKIRCTECGGIIAIENEPISEKGEISIMCNNRKANGKRCKTANIIKRHEVNFYVELPPLQKIDDIPLKPITKRIFS